jgi:hypothetical protein
MDPASPTPDAARDELAFLRGVVERAQQRVDPHAFHFVHWGAIVLVWYPLANVLERLGRHDLMLALGVVAVATGAVLSVVREKRLSGRSRIAGEDAFVGRQVMTVTFASIGGTLVLSVAAPALGFVDGQDVPTLWALAYANLAAMIGVVYRREFLWSGLAIFVAAIAGMAWPQWNGLIVGPAMGLGLLIPGWRAERRVRELAAA